MKIVCATNMPFVEEAFATLGEPVVIEGRSIGPTDVREAELMAVRSTTRIGRELLEGSRVRFVGSATIGVDHIDVPWLEGQGIRWCFSPGCNANSVSEYLTVALLRLAYRSRKALHGRTLGVVGVGNVGSRVAAKGHALGMRVLLNDPPQRDVLRTGASSRFGYAATDFVDLDTLLSEADFVTLHVPLTRSGPYPSFHMADRSFFARMKPGAVLINAARGAAVDTTALVAALHSGHLADAVIDTWEHEPAISTELAALCALATPHIAGHSFEGRAMGTAMVYEAACRHLGVAPRWTIDERWPEPPIPELSPEVPPEPIEHTLYRIVSRIYDIDGDDSRLRETLGGDEAGRRAAFDRLRKDYPMRREFRFTSIRLPPEAPAELADMLRQLGFIDVARS